MTEIELIVSILAVIYIRERCWHKFASRPPQRSAER